MHKELDLSHQNTLERNTMIDLTFSGQLFSRIQLGNSREDILSFNQNSNLNNDVQNMYYEVEKIITTINHPEIVSVETLGLDYHELITKAQ